MQQFSSRDPGEGRGGRRRGKSRVSVGGNKGIFRIKLQSLVEESAASQRWGSKEEVQGREQ